MSLRDAKAATVEELKLDINDPFTNLMAIAMAATDEYWKVRTERDALRYVIDQAARILRGEGVEDQGEAYDKAQRLLDAALRDGTTGK